MRWDWSNNIVKENIDAATAEVKKEELGSETHATMGVSEQTGILPCPFCGGVNITIESPHGREPFQYVAICANSEQAPGCGASSSWELTRKDAIRKWNRRAASQSTPSQAPTDSSKEKGNVPCLAAPSRKQEADATERLAELERENVRRIKHLNRLGSWAQQDPAGPMPFIDGHKIQEWVLAELKAALGSAYEPTEWQPDYIKLQDKVKKLEAAATRVEPTKLWRHSECGDGTGQWFRIWCGETLIGEVKGSTNAKTIVNAHNASCAVKEKTL